MKVGIASGIASYVVPDYPKGNRAYVAYVAFHNILNPKPANIKNCIFEQARIVGLLRTFAKAPICCVAAGLPSILIHFARTPKTTPNYHLCT